MFIGIIGITGTIASGKGKIAELLREKCFVHHSLSFEIRAVAKEKGLVVNRQNLSKLGTELHKKGSNVLAEKTLEKVLKDIAKGKKRFVIEGFRLPKQVNLFRKHEFESKELRFVLIGVDAPVEKRFERLKKRGRRGDPKTLMEFKKIDAEEIATGGGQEIGKTLKMADYVIDNSGSLKELEKKVAGIIKELQ